MSPKATGEGLRDIAFFRDPVELAKEFSTAGTPHPAAPQPPSPYGRGLEPPFVSNIPLNTFSGVIGSESTRTPTAS